MIADICPGCNEPAHTSETDVTAGDLSDSELDRWLASVPCCRYEPRDMQRMAREIKRRRAEQRPTGPWCTPPWADKDGRFRP